MSASMKCFFITPISEPETNERKRSDFIMDVLLTPALVQCGFSAENIVRADQLLGNNTVEDMKYHLDNDELCIADITGNNFNVLYEFGYRRGLGKPVILIRDHNDDKKVPFDIAAERIITYDFGSESAFIELPKTINTLRKRVQQIVDGGFVPNEGSGSIRDILDKLNSLETRMNRLLARISTTNPGAVLTTNVGSVAKIVEEFGSPIGAFNYALKTRDTSLAENLLPWLEPLLAKDRYINQAVSQVSAMGSETAAEILEKEWKYITESLTLQAQYQALGCYVSYCNSRDCELEKLDFVVNAANALMKKAVDNNDKDVEAGVYNQLNRLYFGAYKSQKNNGIIKPDYLDKAIDACLRATNIKEDEESFFYNLATCYREKGMDTDDISAKRQGLAAIDKCMALGKGDPDPDHLAFAYRIYKENDCLEKAEEAKNRLRIIAPLRAELLQ